MGERRQYTEDTTSKAAQTSLLAGVLRHIQHMELDELLGRTTGRLGYIGPATPSEGRQSWHNHTLPSPQLPQDPFTVSDDYRGTGKNELLEERHCRRYRRRRGRRTFPGTTGRMEQRAD
jgi:hypothetical protein